VFDLLLRYAVSEEGALHAEKYYQTVAEEFGFLRPAFRWRELAALARVTTSEDGYPARGYAEASQLLRASWFLSRGSAGAFPCRPPVTPTDATSGRLTATRCGTSGSRC